MLTPNFITSTAIKRQFEFMIVLIKYQSVFNYLSKPNMAEKNGRVWKIHLFHPHFLYLGTAPAMCPFKIWPKVEAAM